MILKTQERIYEWMPLGMLIFQPLTLTYILCACAHGQHYLRKVK